MREAREALTVREVTKRFGETVALEGFSLELRRNTLLALLGPSGCGKTTALRIIAGFERPDQGAVWIGSREVAGNGAWVQPEKRRVGMVFQDWALFGHLTVRENVAFGLPRGRDDRIHEVLSLVHLTGLEDRMPHELSGGQQQRTALARALAPSPEVILLDEPFSNLDATLRAKVRGEVREVLREAHATAVFVTHDREEALAIADEMAVMSEGRVLQTGPPHELYMSPSDRRVASLVGEANFLLGEARLGHVATAIGTVPTPGLRKEGPAEVMVRPESIRLDPDDASPAQVVNIEFYGHDQLVRVRLADGTVLDARLSGPHPEFAPGARVKVSVTGSVHVFR